jgi:hypothetical protein
MLNATMWNAAMETAVSWGELKLHRFSNAARIQVTSLAVARQGIALGELHYAGAALRVSSMTASTTTPYIAVITATVPVDL